MTTNKSTGNPFCKHCGSGNVVKYGYDIRKSGALQRYKCKDCKGSMFGPIENTIPSKIAQQESQAVMIPQAPAVDGTILHSNGTGKLGITEEELRSKHDNNYKMNEAVNKLSLGIFLTEQEFIKFAGIKTGMGYRASLENRDYDVYHGKAGGTVYWSHPESIKKLKDDSVLD